MASTSTNQNAMDMYQNLRSPYYLHLGENPRILSINN